MCVFPAEVNQDNTPLFTVYLVLFFTLAYVLLLTVLFKVAPQVVLKCHPVS